MRNIDVDLDKILQSIINNGFKGYDPYDFFNKKNLPSWIYNSSIGSKFTFLNKISPINFRPLLGIKPTYNSKAMALMLLALLKYKPEQHEKEIKFIIDWLITNKSPEYKEYAIGFTFNIAMQSYVSEQKQASLIISLFTMYAFCEYYRQTKNSTVLNHILSFQKLIESTLPIHETDQTIWYSYNFDKNNEIYNATAKVGKFYAYLYQIENKEEYKQKIKKILNYLKEKQRTDGSWPYGEKITYTDGYHTAFVLDAIWHMTKIVSEKQYEEMFLKGMHDYKNNLFSLNQPLHFHPKYAPKDVRSKLLHTEIRDCANAIILFALVNEKKLADTVLEWTFKNIYDSKQYFYFYKSKWMNSKINFVRWQAWMAYALSEYKNYYKI